MENLGIDYKLLIAQLINFGLFFFIFKRFIAKPFVQFLNQERGKEEERARLLEEIKKREEKFSQEEAERKKDLKKDIDSIMARAREDGERLRKELSESARKEAAALLENGKKQLDEERNSLLREMKNRTGELSVMLIRDALKDYLDADTQKKLTQHILTGMAKEVK